MGLTGSVAITGYGTYFGRRIAAELLARGHRVVALDLVRPAELDPRLAFHAVDLTAPAVPASLVEILRKEGVEVLVHLAFRTSPSPDLVYDHELETLGSVHVLQACAEAATARLVIASTTMVYGPHPDNPNFLGEEHPLRGHPEAHSVRNRVEVEGLVRDFAHRHPNVAVTVLRPCWVMGPGYRDHVTGMLGAAVVPRIAGYDPLLQLVHEDDLLSAYLQATAAPHPGVFNVVGRGVLPLSQLLALAGKRAPAVPRSLFEWTFGAALRARTGDPAAATYDYLRYLWVADGRRGWEEFGEPVYSTREAWSAFLGAERMRPYA